MLVDKKDTKTKYIVMTGGVLSGVGKGTATASIGRLLQEQGFRINLMKIDPYVNVDAGTMRPTEHGEVFVTHDGGETDQDIGNYERFLDKEFSRKNNITTGQVFMNVIKKERNLHYAGECVSMIPHIPDEVKRRIRKSSEEDDADFTIIEVGGTTGDHENVLFLEALREMKLEKEDIIFVHIVYLPVPGNIGEMKTKPAQHSVRYLNSVGIQPDFLLGRGSKPLDSVRRTKLANFSNMPENHVFSAPDIDSIYDIPINFDKEHFTKMILDKFGLEHKEGTLEEWKKRSEKIKRLKRDGRKMNIGIVGKYFDIGDFVLEDSYVSVIEAIKHASYHNNVYPEISWIDSKNCEEYSETHFLEQYDGIIVPGGFGATGVEGKINAIRFCREKGKPFLGLCYGLQLAVVEFARNVCKINAHTTEIDKQTEHPIIDILPEQRELLRRKKYGASMRLGNYVALLEKGSKTASLYKKENAVERHRHRYEVNPKYMNLLVENGLRISGKSPDGKLVEFIEMDEHPFFLATQAHPEFTSRLERPNPVFLGLIRAMKEKKSGKKQQ
ncbi:MAG: CTP synthase [Candidatus Woesearchaeota archaeon]